MYDSYFDKIVLNENITNKQRKSIFRNSHYYSKKTSMQNRSLIMPKDTHIQIKTIPNDQCGCQHNLQPCPIIKELLVGVNEKNMRIEYDNLQKQNRFKPKFQIRRKYLRFLPSYYPQLYHAQLSNIVTNIQQDLSLNQFINLAWIEYHSKYEYLTYFLFVDMNRCKQSKKVFFDKLQLQLISREADFYSIINESKSLNINLIGFMEDYHQSFATNVVPLSQYGKFIRILLKQGEKSLKKLLVFLLTTKKQFVFDLLKSYNSAQLFRQNCKQLDWQQILQNLSQSNE